MAFCSYGDVSCHRQAEYSSGGQYSCPPSSADVFLKLRGLKYGTSTYANASLKMRLTPERTSATTNWIPGVLSKRLTEVNGGDGDHLLVSPHRHKEVWENHNGPRYPSYAT